MLREIQYCSFPSPTNIYGSCVAFYRNKLHLLVATKKQLFTVTSPASLSTNSSLVASAASPTFAPSSLATSPGWVLQPIHLPTIQGEHDIVSLDCISEQNNAAENIKLSPILAFTTCKSAPSNPSSNAPSSSATPISPPSSYLHIYIPDTKLAHHIPSDDLSVLFSSSSYDSAPSPVSFSSSTSSSSSLQPLSSVVVCACQRLALDFVPFQLSHVKLKSQQHCLLLSGSDAKIHLYQQQQQHQQGEGRAFFTEISVVDYFPELASLPSNVICFDIQETQTKRITAVGCQDGQVHLTVTGTGSDQRSVSLDGCISAVKIYIRTETESQQQVGIHGGFQQLAHNMKLASSSLVAPLPIFSSEILVDLLVADAIGYAISYKNVLGSWFKDGELLPRSDCYDSITCMQIADVDFDGNNEIILGTYGQEVLIYKELPGKHNEFSLVYQHSLPQPVLALHWADMSNDGANNLIVISLMGIHILEINLQKAREDILSTLSLLKEIRDLEDRVQYEQKRQEALKETEHVINKKLHQLQQQQQQQQQQQLPPEATVICMPDPPGPAQREREHDKDDFHLF